MKRYDPLKEPDPKEWLGLDEQERVGLIAEHHEKAGVTLPNHILHASFHAIAENQLAEGLPVVCETMSRLMSEGLDRHEAIHAIGSVLAEHMWNILKDRSPDSDLNELYFQALRALTAAGWLRSTR
ncbi:MAG: DUF1841 family protein [Candidatus Eisenbacteria bacterium]|nr:DUF1841 family protein [Candidatus Eisenbacteria bacterium]